MAAEPSPAKQIIVPAFELREASVNSALAAIETALHEAQPQAGINVQKIIAPVDEGAGPRITLKLTNIPLEDVLRYVCTAANLRYRVEPNAIVIYSPEFEPQRMVTRIYHVNPGSFDNEIRASTLVLPQIQRTH